jgi:hypothetical protein
MTIAQTPTPRDCFGITADEFRARIRALGMSMGQFAELTSINPTTVSYYGRHRPGDGPVAMPAWVPLLISAWEAAPHAIPLSGSRSLNGSTTARAG